MQSKELKAERIRHGYKQRDVARQLQISELSYRKKENGEVRFTDVEKLKLRDLLGLSLEQFDDYFYDGALLRKGDEPAELTTAEQRELHDLLKRYLGFFVG